MANEAITHRRRIRQRFDITALHRTDELDASNTTQDIRLDIVAKQLTVSVPAGLTVNVTGSLDGTTFFAIGMAAITNTLSTYGKDPSHHLIKVLRFARTAGSGRCGVVAV
jgi:hypothetical protein